MSENISTVTNAGGAHGGQTKGRHETLISGERETDTIEDFVGRSSMERNKPRTTFVHYDRIGENVGRK